MKAGGQCNNFFLIGPMGSGKTSVAAKLALLTGLALHDSDEEIARQTGVDIPWIFEVEGEAGFRQREAVVIRELTALNNIILSTGGGTILQKANRDRLAERGTVIYLKASLDEQFKRATSRKNTRPLLNGENPKEKLNLLNQARLPLYESIADVTLETDGSSPLDLAKKILSTLVTAT